jgi:hypothetical protein
MSALYLLVSLACLGVGGYLILAQLKILGKEPQEGDRDFDVKGLIIGAIFVTVGVVLIAI